MRDLLVAFIVIACLPVILFRPDIGVMVWTWLGLMNPHRLSWGFALEFPFAQVVAIATFSGMVLSRKWKFPPVTAETAILAIFVLWTVCTTLFALNPFDAWDELTRFLKIQLMVLVSLMVIRTREQLRTLIWVIACSLGFFGVKGGLFTILSGGEYLVLGPPDTFIGGNNELALALVMTIPLMRYLQLTTPNRWSKHGLLLAIVLTSIAILGTHSRGGVLGIIAMLASMMWRSRYRVGLALLLCILIPVSLSLMPPNWFDRMDTIRDYRSDASATGRINAWFFAFNLAVDRPVIGGGFNCFTPELFQKYAPDPADFHDAHSIYFEVLGEHGFVGLWLFLCLALSVSWSCSRLIQRARLNPELSEIEHLGRMIQVSLVAYAVSGAFLGLAYFDLVYTLVAAVVIAKTLLSAAGDLTVDVGYVEMSPSTIRPRPRLGPSGSRSLRR